MTGPKLDIEILDAQKYEEPDIETWRWFAAVGLVAAIAAVDAALWFFVMKGREATFLTWMERFMQ